MAAVRQRSRGANSQDNLAAQHDTSDKNEPPVEGHKTMLVAVMLWLVGGVFGLHHFYLRRPFQGFLWMVTVGGFGIGLLYDLFRLSAYVEEANLTAATRITHSIYANKKRRAAMLAPRFVGQVIFAAYLRQVVFWAVPQAPEDGISHPLAIASALSTVTVAATVYLIGVQGYRTSSFKWTLLAAALGEVWAMQSASYVKELDVHNYEPGCNGSFGCGLWVALLAAIGFVRSSTYLELPKRPKRSSCWKHTLVVGLGVVLFWAMIGSYVFYNTTVTIDEKGDTKRFKEVVNEFFESRQWQEIKASMQECMRDKGRCFSLIVEHLDIGGSRSAYATLDLKEGASMSEVRSAFREKARLWHPDKCAKPECAKKFRELRDAYERIQKERR